MMRCLAACTAARPKTAKSMGSSMTSPTSKLSSKLLASSSEIWLLESSTAPTTVLSSTIRMSPLPSSMLTSACTFGPYFFASAARMPSWRRAYSSARSSCFVFDTSRNAASISAELTIQIPSGLLHVKRQPRLLDVSQRDATLRARLGRNYSDFRSGLSLHADDFSLDAAAVLRGQHVGPLPDEPPPFRRRAKQTLPWRRHLQHVVGRNEPARIEPRLQRSRDPSAIVYRDGRVVPPIDPHLDERPVS